MSKFIIATIVYRRSGAREAKTIVQLRDANGEPVQKFKSAVFGVDANARVEAGKQRIPHQRMECAGVG